MQQLIARANLQAGPQGFAAVHLLVVQRLVWEDCSLLLMHTCQLQFS